MKKEVYELLSLAKGVVDRDIYRRLKEIEDEKELELAIKHSILKALELEHIKIENEIRELEEQNRDVFFAKTRSLLIKGKIKNFEASFNKSDLYKVNKLFNDIRKEIRDVAI